MFAVAYFRTLPPTPKQLKQWQCQKQKKYKGTTAPQKVRRQKARRQALRQKRQTPLNPKNPDYDDPK